MKKSFIDVSWATQLTFKVNNRNIRKRYAIYLKLAPLSNVSIVKFEQVNVSWENKSLSDAGLKPIRSIFIESVIGSLCYFFRFMPIIASFPITISDETAN